MWLTCHAQGWYFPIKFTSTMITTFRKCVFYLLSVTTVVFFTGCGGDGKAEQGYAPDNLGGSTLQITTEAATGVSPGVVNIMQETASFGTIVFGPSFQSQVFYDKISKNEANVGFSIKDPETVGQPYTKVYTFSASLVFNEDGMTGYVTRWVYKESEYLYGGSVLENVGEGTDGRFVLVRN